jgi:hypothetical protein
MSDYIHITSLSLYYMPHYRVYYISCYTVDYMNHYIELHVRLHIHYIFVLSVQVAPARTLKGGVLLYRNLPTHPYSLAHVLSVLQCGAAYEIQVQEGMACVFSVLAVSQCESCAIADLINRQGLLAFQFKKLRRQLRWQSCLGDP